VSSVTPTIISVATVPDCATYYAAERNDAQPEHLASYQFKMPTAANVVYAVGHQHVGALNISLVVNDKIACTSFPRYGTQDDVAGDEKGYVVQMSTCVDEASGPLRLAKGDVVRIDSWYYVGSDDKRLLYSDGTHLNVMGYMYMGFTKADGTRLQGSEEQLLGPPQPRPSDLPKPVHWERSVVRGTPTWRQAAAPAAADVEEA